MKSRFLLIPILSALVPISVGLGGNQEPIPKPVKSAIEASDACYHWAGEVGDQTEERNRTISEGVERDCPDAKRKAIEARKRFPANRYLILPLLKLNDIGYFDLSDEEKTKLCEQGAQLLKSGFFAAHDQDSYFKAFCPQQAAAASK